MFSGPAELRVRISHSAFSGFYKEMIILLKVKKLVKRGMFRILTSVLLQPIWLELKLILKILNSNILKLHFYKKSNVVGPNTKNLIQRGPNFYLVSFLTISVIQVRMDQGLAVKIRCPMRS